MILYLCKYVYICTNVYFHVCVSIYIYTNVYMCMYIEAYIYNIYLYTAVEYTVCISAER